jgi:hypothetical protein
MTAPLLNPEVCRDPPEHGQENWLGGDWIVEVISDTVERNGKRGVRRHLNRCNKRTSRWDNKRTSRWDTSMRTSRCDTSKRTTPKVLLRRFQQHSILENEGHWARDAQLGRSLMVTQTGSGRRLCSPAYGRSCWWRSRPEATSAQARRFPLQSPGPQRTDLRHLGNAGIGRSGAGLRHLVILLLGDPGTQLLLLLAVARLRALMRTPMRTLNGALLLILLDWYPS